LLTVQASDRSQRLRNQRLSYLHSGTTIQGRIHLVSPISLQPILRTLAIAAGLACAVLLFGTVTSAEARGGCGKTGVASKRSDRVGLPGARDAVRCLINDERSGRSLKLRRSLNKAAQRHSRRMFEQRCFSHQCSGEASTVDRIRKAGYMSGARSWRVGEVIALNSDRASPREVVRQWKRSPGHRVQIMDGGYEHIGVGMIARKGKAFYTVTLGARSG
jgi:hypothetical protein